MSLNEVLKASKTERFPDYWTLLWGRKLSASMIKTLTGTLPLTFTAKAGAAVTWTIYGNDEIGKNLLPVRDTLSPLENHGISVTVENHNVHIYGTLDVDEETVITGWWTEWATGDEIGHVGEVILTGSPNYSSTGIRLRVGEALKVAPYENIIGYDEGDGIQFTMREQAIAYTVQLVLSSDLYDKPIDEWFRIMLRPADTSPEFEPYQVGVGERTKNLLEITGEDELVTRGITFTHDKNNHTIRVNGRATGNAFYACGEVTLKAGTQYILSGCPAGGSASGTYTYQLYVAGHSDWGSDTGNGLTLPIMTEDTVVTPRIGVYTGAGELTDLIFKAMIREADTTSEFIPYGYQVPLDIRHKTKNYVDLSDVTDSTHNGVTFTVDSANGTITANRTATSTANASKSFTMTLPAGTYIFSCGEDSQRDVTYDSYLRVGGSSPVTIARDNPDDPPGSEFTLTTETLFTFYIRIQRSYNAQNLVFRPMIRRADTTPDFEPYYLTNHEDIYIGASPLTEGETVSKTSTCVDIELFDGTNTLDNTLYNKPEVEIKYK